MPRLASFVSLASVLASVLVSMLASVLASAGTFCVLILFHSWPAAFIQPAPSLDDSSLSPTVVTVTSSEGGRTTSG